MSIRMANVKIVPKHLPAHQIFENQIINWIQTALLKLVFQIFPN